MPENVYRLTCEKCFKSDWDVSKRVIRGVLRILCNTCAQREKIANDGT